MKKIALLSSVTALALMSAAAVACTPMAAGKLATSDGSVMVSHTCDSWYDARLKVIPAADHKEGETVDIKVISCMDTRPGHKLVTSGTIPQVAHTYRYFHVGYPFLNEKGVMLGEHTWTGRDEMNNTAGIFYIENLEDMALQRAATAREAIKVMGELAEKYGYGDGGEGLVVTDGDELWYFEICGPGLLWSKDSGKPGAHWAARRIPDDSYFIAANRSRLGVIDFNDKDNFMYSTDITKLAEEQGWWKQGEEFNFSKIFDPANFGDTAKYDFWASRREWRGFSMVAPSQSFTAGSGKQEYPFAVKPDKKLTVDDFKAIYRDHYEGTPYDLTKGLDAGPFGDPARWRPLFPKVEDESLKNRSWERPIAVPQCSYSFIGKSRHDMPDPVKAIVWFGLAAPDTTVYVPLFSGVTETPKSWNEFERVKFDKDSAFWAFELGQMYSHLRWDVAYPYMQQHQKELEDKLLNKVAEFEPTVNQLPQDKTAEAEKKVTEFVNNQMMETQNAWWDVVYGLIAQVRLPSLVKEDGFESAPYREEWLKAVDFGSSIKADIDAGK